MVASQPSRRRHYQHAPVLMLQQEEAWAQGRAGEFSGRSQAEPLAAARLQNDRLEEGVTKSSKSARTLTAAARSKYLEQRRRPAVFAAQHRGGTEFELRDSLHTLAC